MSKVYQIRQVRMIKDLKEFKKNKSVSGFLIDYFNKNNITKKKFYQFCEGMAKTESRELYAILVDAYHKYSNNNTEIDLQLRYDIEDAYFVVTNNLMSNNNIFSFKSIMKKYRKDMNPVRALYFEILEIGINFNSGDFDHEYIKEQFKNEPWYKKLFTAIESDLENLSNIEKKFDLLKKRYQFFTLPISYYHTQEMIKDMRKQLNAFDKFYKKINNIKSRYD